MIITDEAIRQLEQDFKENRKLLTAIGDETRQYLLMIMLSMECAGSRVTDIAERTRLSRPAVSHHMQILKDAGIVKSRKEGRLIYYYLAPDSGKLEGLIKLIQTIKDMAESAPDRSEEAFELGILKK